MKFEMLCGSLGSGSCGFCRVEFDPAAVALREDFVKGVIQGIDKSGIAAEIRGQADGMQRERFLLSEFEASLLDAPEELGLGVAERVDRLDRVADHEDGAARAIGPCGDERGDELVLAAAGVLEFVHQQVMYVVGN